MSEPHTEIPSVPLIELEGGTVDINYYLTKEYTDIGVAAIELPALIEALNWQNQINVENLHRRKSELGRAEATAYFALKGGGYQQKGYGEKATDKGVEYGVRLDPDVANLEEDVAVLTAWTERLRNLMKSLQAKLELVRSTEATRRRLPESPA